MPNRILRDGILTSEAVNSLDWAAEVFFRRLMSVADDHGRYHASPKLLRAHCYPLQIDRVTDIDVEGWVGACVANDLVKRYRGTDGKAYLQLLKFGQQVRAKSKFPEPDGGVSEQVDKAGAQSPVARSQPSVNGEQPVSGCDPPASVCEQLLANDHLVGVGVGDEDGGGETSPTPPPAAPSAKRSKPRSALDFESLPDDWRETARRKLPGWPHDELFGEFRLHHLSKGTSAASWPASWGLWLSRAPEYSRHLAPNRNGSNGHHRQPTEGKYSATIRGLTGRDRQPETIDVESREIPPTPARRLG